MLDHYWAIVATLAQHQANTGSTSRVCWEMFDSKAETI